MKELKKALWDVWKNKNNPVVRLVEVFCVNEAKDFILVCDDCWLKQHCERVIKYGKYTIDKMHQFDPALFAYLEFFIVDNRRK